MDSPRIIQPKNYVPRSKCAPCSPRTDENVNTEDTLSGFQDFFLQPIIKDRSNTICALYRYILFVMVFHSLKKCKARLTALSHTFLDMKDHHHIGIRRRVSYIHYVLCKHVMANCS